MDGTKVGLLLWDFLEINDIENEWMKKCREYCDKLIMVIPEDDVYRRAFASDPRLTFDRKKQQLFSQMGNDIAEIIPLPYRCVEPDFFQRLHDTYPFQVFFYGTDYGQEFLNEKRELEKRNVSFVPLFSLRVRKEKIYDSFCYMLHNLMPDIKIILFGAGKYFDIFMERYGADFRPEYAVDNNQSLWGTQKSGIWIYSPDKLKKENVSRTIVILCSKYYESMKEQLLSIDSFDYRVLQRNENISFLHEYITAMRCEGRYLDEAHRNLRILLHEIDRVCAEHHLHYYVIGGSLIGVLRHQDFIPWDDDLDISMTRKDYEYLRKHADEIWKGTDFRLVEPDKLGGNAFSDLFPRILYKKGYVCSKTYVKVKGKADEEIQNKYVIDIFLLDNASDRLWKHKLVTTMMKGVYGLLMGHRAYVDYDTFDRLSSAGLFGVKVLVQIGKFIPAKWLFSAYDKLSRYAQKEKGKYYFESSGNIHYMPLLHRRDIFGKGQKMRMGDLMVSVPFKPEDSLTSKGYRNFMNFPPVIDRKPEHTGRNKGVLW